MVRISVQTHLRTFLQKGWCMHAQTMCTRPFLLPLKGPGNEAIRGLEQVPYFPAISACAYISTGRKPALNSKVRLIARFA